MAEQKQYPRFSPAQRVEHWIMFASFTILAVTGLPQKFVGNAWAEQMIQIMGGIEFVRLIHHLAAVVMVLGSIYHIVAIAYKIYVVRVRWTMFPRFDDVLDALDAIRYNLGLTKEHPKFDRFNFGEKFEYWAFVWGTVVMALTGFMMWNPINTARFVPGDLIPAAKAAHGGEALLAVLAILIWHFYNVHIKMFNRAMFTGKMPEHQMEEEHGLELERLHQGKTDKRPPAEVVKQRERLFIPIALGFSVVMLLGVYFFTTYEQTAITTLPRRADVQVFSPITPTPTLRAGATVAPVIAAPKPLTESHVGRTQCNVCHEAGIAGPKNPADHAGRADATCSACHKLSTGVATPIAGATPPVSAPATSGGIKPLPATHDGRTTCNVCHETGVAGPKNPADHAGRADATCSACHKPASSAVPAAPTAAAKPAVAPTTGAATVAPTAAAKPSVAPTTGAGTTVPTAAAKPTVAPATGAAPAATKPSATTAPAGGAGVAKVLPASHAGRAICNVCHETGASGPKNPADHAGRADATCVACHKLP
ncbi:MAG: cytochrome b/b6 domain-containing protein [Chloroflexi bacterium]|nr:cytochrome b/b6 domain-containing protein [Chloroflexota bacterium]